MMSSKTISERSTRFDGSIPEMYGKGGTLILNVWDSIDRNPVQLTAHSMIGRFF